MKRSVMVLSCAALCACMGPLKSVGLMPEDKFTPQIEKWVGRSADDLVAIKGAPVNVYQLDAGGRQFEYLGRSLVTKGTLSSKENEGLRELYNAEEGASVQDPVTKNAQAGARRKTIKPQARKCIVLFNIGADNLIKSWTSEGSGCN